MRCPPGVPATLAAAAVAAFAAVAGPALAQTVTLNGSMGERALLVIDGQARTLAVGSTVQGVRLLSFSGAEAVVEFEGGRRTSLRMGAAQANVGGAARRGGSEIVLPAGPGGHFFGDGRINGKSVRFLVDTGATSVAMSQAEAQRLGLNYRAGPRAMANTANGPVPVSLVTLNSVRLGEVEVYDVPALVLPSAMDHVLLGNSFLNRFQMRRDNDVMRLEKKP